MKKLLLILIALASAHFLFAQEKTNIAILELEANGVTKSDARTLTNKLRGELIKTGRFDVIERNQMKAILDEQGFQQTGCISEECAVKIGQLIGVKKIIAGSIGKIENTYIISIRMIDVGRGKVIKNVDDEIPGSLTDVLKVGVHNVARKIAGFTDGFLKVADNKKLDSNKAIVWFINLRSIDHLYLDHKTKILVDGNKNQRKKRSLTEISPGRHIMHNDINYCLRYYYEFDVKKGDNFLEPKFVENRLPGLSRHFTWSEEKKENRIEAERTADYFIYDDGKNKIKKKAKLKFSVDISKKPGNSDELVFNYKWNVEVNGKVISDDQITEVRSQKAAGTYRKKVVIYSDKDHYYTVHYYIIRKSTELNISSGYIDYLKQ